MTPTIPTLETDRLILRAPVSRDFPAFAEFYASDRSTYVGGPMDEPTTWRHFAATIGHWALRGFGMWNVELKQTGTWVGMVGCWYPIEWPEREIGWVVTAEGEGRSIGYEAACAARDHAFDTLGWDTAVSYIDPANARSIALADRLGAVRDAGAAHPGHAPCLVYRHSRGAPA